MKPIRLHLGCGLRKLEGYINCDISKDVNPDIVVDIANLSKKFKPNSVDEILIEHTLEHVKDFEKAMKEMHKVLKPSGRTVIVVPYAGIASAFHPYHFWYFSKESFDPFHKDDWRRHYYDFHFSKVETKLVFDSWMKFISWFANRKYWFYENSFLVRLFPAKELRVELIK